MPRILTSPKVTDSEAIGEDDNSALDAAPAKKECPDFAPFFDVNTPLPGERSKEWKGYVIGLDVELYHAFPAANYSTLKEKTPAEMLHSMMSTREDDYATEARAKAFTVGTFAHWATLEPHKIMQWKEHMIVSPTSGLATKKAQACRAENPDKLLVTPELVDIGRRCLEAVQANPTAMAYLQGRDPEDGSAKPSPVTSEASGFVWDGVIWRKSRVDLLPQKLNYLLDVKSTRVHPSQWRSECFKMGYFGQAVYYIRNHLVLTGEPRDFVWVVVTKSEPYMCRVFKMRYLQKNDPLFDESIFKSQMESMGLVPSLRIGKLPMFVNSSRETQQMRAVCELTPAILRNCWQAFENESPVCELIV